jgi:2-polyprenyl-6-methoxyphenol hydroxylase-like FAD-dependent oxidoreductase
MTGQSVLISGIGVAGPALAWWLLEHGFRPTLVERAPRLRTGGYMIDFWGVGYDLAERMGLLPAILEAGYRVRAVRIVNESGRRVGGFRTDAFFSATGGRFTSLARGDLSAVLYDAVAHRVETIFADSVTSIDAWGDGAIVTFEHAAARRFDIVIGADGLHSRVRTLAFGARTDIERFMGYVVAAFDVAGYRPRDEDVYIGLGAPGRQVTRFSMRGDRTMFLLVAADDEASTIDPHDRTAHEAYLRRGFAGLGWECPAILDAMPRAGDLYFDRVSQIRLDAWSKGPIGLVGDAAFAPSLLAGQGSALAIIAAYVLAGELSRARSVDEAFARYQQVLGPFIRDKQRAAEKFAGSFAPRTTLGLIVRNLSTYAMAIPGVTRLLMGRSLLDRIQLQEY